MATVLLAFSCGSKDNPEPTPVPDSIPKDITLSVSSINAESAGGSFEVTVTSPFVPQVDKPSWVSVTNGTFKDYSLTMTVVVAANTAYEARSAELTFSATGATSAKLTVTQAAAEKPVDPTPGEITRKLATSNPSARAQALYDYIYGLYGNKTLSSVMADVNWNHKLADKVAQSTGKYPAMNCYDFIHIYVPKNNWIDYSDLTPVTEWADAGGIVSLMWHFNVPKNQNTTPGTDGSGVTCTPSETTFRARNVFTEGSWENKWFYAQMDKVVEVILALQAKGIPAIWRPFHEAAGNATYKQTASWATAWFWWGYDGADVFKKLWQTMFDYFASKGVNNLIWVWTSQNFNGDASQYNQDKDWYPGDAYVDMVARDLYGYTAARNVTEFSELQKAYPTKMVTLGECGSLVEYNTDGSVKSKTSFANVSDWWKEGAKWSWFMPWYGDCLPDDAWWNDAMKQSAVVSRSDVKF